MFKKVLKYDMASVKRYWWLIAVAVLGIAVVGSLVFRGVSVHFDSEMNGSTDMLADLMAMAGIIFLFVCVIAVFSSVIVTPVMTNLRFYSNFFTDEGYLTFTLPISRKTLYLSKTVNSIFWEFAHMLLLLAGIAIVITLAPVPESGVLLNFELWEGLGTVVSKLWNEFGAWLFVYVSELLLIYLCASAMSVGLIQLCITIGSIIAKKHKLLASIGLYFAINMGTSTVSQVIMSFASLFLSSGIFVLLANASAGVRNGAIALAMLLYALIVSAVALILHFVSLGLLERKLNLA